VFFDVYSFHSFIHSFIHSFWLFGSERIGSSHATITIDVCLSFSSSSILPIHIHKKYILFFTLR
jgi:hypothetical protein